MAKATIKRVVVMWKFGLSAFAVVIIMLSATTAEARRGFGFSSGGTQQILEFVTELDATKGETSLTGLSLCHLIEKHSISFIPTSYVSQGYVFSDDKCTGTSYYEVNFGALAEMKTAGMLPADFPDNPTLSFNQRATPYFVYGFIICIALFFVVQKLRQNGFQSKMPKTARSQTAPDFKPVFENHDSALTFKTDLQSMLMIEVLCHVAKDGWELKEADIPRIIAIAQRFLTKDYDAPRILRMIKNLRSGLTLHRFHDIAQQITPEQKETVFQAAMLFTDGYTAASPGTKIFISGLSEALSISKQRFGQIIAEHRRPAPA